MSLTLPIARMPHTLNPLTIRNAQIVRFVFDGLTRLDPSTGAPVPALAESWRIDPGGKVYTFQIRPDVLWSNRRPFGPEDVLFTLDRLVLSEDIRNPYRELLRVPAPGGGGFPRVERVSETEIRLTLPAPFPPLLRALSYIPILPEHRLEADLAQGMIHLSWRTSESPRKVVGTGPFTPDEIDPGREVRLRRNPYYWERDRDGSRLPRLDRIIFRVVRDPVQALLDGEIDLLVADSNRIGEIRPHARGSSIDLLDAGPLGEATFLVFRHRPTSLGRVFAQKKFRQAISHALDRHQMVETIFGGLGRVQRSPISKANPYFHNDEIRTYPFDPVLAMRGLDEIGAKDRDRDGVRETPDGQPLSFDILVSVSTNHTFDIALQIEANLRAIGIRARSRPIAPDRLFDAIQSGQWDAIVHTIPEAIDPQLLSRIWASDASMHYWNPSQSEPATPWEAEIDQIFRDARRELDDEKRRKLYRRFQEIAAEEVPL
ncbi:MAG: ABC transporter substrate-binding protein, partial [Planctomycetota bacterium]|nr:ABC transporter substrate-binding protein [Planctomycetota bacterium]